MTYKARREHAQQRRRRLPPFVKNLIKNRDAALERGRLSPQARLLIAAGVEPAEGMGMAEFDAAVALLADAVGLKHLSDDAFGRALKLFESAQ